MSAEKPRKDWIKGVIRMEFFATMEDAEVLMSTIRNVSRARKFKADISFIKPWEDSPVEEERAR